MSKRQVNPRRTRCSVSPSSTFTALLQLTDGLGFGQATLRPDRHGSLYWRRLVQKSCDNVNVASGHFRLSQRREVSCTAMNYGNFGEMFWTEARIEQP